ncbi:MAG: DUF547 domain-containing protein [Erythrobacter sp.]|uniref:DUF547 domain-containing protein n=1 Tax=Erythrobacter sp. TaxID=1042 RepID=UPI003298C613
MKFKPLVIMCLLPAVAGCTSLERLAIPSSELVSAQFQAAGTQDSISNEAWDSFLSSYTTLGEDGIVRVDYGAVSADDKQKLDSYVDYLAAQDATQFTRDAQLAYWINLYNALTVSVILDNYPVDSIRDISTSPLDFGPWGEKRIVVNGRELGLHDIEHGIVRPLWSEEPRIHYALNCAAFGCPNLAQSAYTASNLEQKLQENSVLYINDPRGVSVGEDGKVTLSKIFSWYREDYGGSEETVLVHVRQYAEPDLLAALDQPDLSISYAYDWSLNDTATAAQGPQ